MNNTTKVMITADDIMTVEVTITTKTEVVTLKDGKLTSTKIVNDPVTPSILNTDEDKGVIYDGGSIFESKRWFDDKGRLHRDGDKPAIEYKSGKKCWYRKGQLHRDNDKPALIDEDGNQRWYHHGMLHRDNDQPAICIGDQQYWYQYDKHHRDGGKPAFIIMKNGKVSKEEYYVDGKLTRTSTYHD